MIVTLHYNIDPESGIAARSATIENHEPKPIMIDQAAATVLAVARKGFAQTARSSWLWFRTRARALLISVMVNPTQEERYVSWVIPESLNRWIIFIYCG